MLAAGALLALAGSGLAAYAAKPAKPGKPMPTQSTTETTPSKVTVCHKAKVTIRVSSHAWPGHQRHGDVQGLCVQTAGDAAKAAKSKAKAERKAAKQAAKPGKNDG
jgi:hypothetical protein